MLKQVGLVQTLNCVQTGKNEVPVFIKTYKDTVQSRQVDGYEDIIQNLNDDQKNVIMEAGGKSIDLGKGFMDAWLSKFN